MPQVFLLVLLALSKIEDYILYFTSRYAVVQVRLPSGRLTPQQLTCGKDTSSGCVTPLLLFYPTCQLSRVHTRRCENRLSILFMLNVLLRLLLLFAREKHYCTFERCCQEN